jgi:Rieske Fe-S protein
MENTSISRRRFLLNLTVLGSAAALPLIASQQSARADDTYVPVGKASWFALNDFKRVVLPDSTSIYVGKTDNKDTPYLALSSKCTHRGCEVLWIADSKQFKCPCHGGKFDASGTNIAGPPPSPLKSYPVKVVKGDVMVDA